jgi:hypothetical protein
MHTEALSECSHETPPAQLRQRKAGSRAIFGTAGFVFITLALMLFEFGGALTSYFTSDDLSHITYAHRMFKNNGELFFRTFSTVWMQDYSTEIFYRPLIEVSFALDHLVSGANPLGYHISNFLFSFFAALALLSVSRSLAERFQVPHVALIGYAAALLFAVSPLHTEVTTWLIGRVDGLSTMYYLIAFALFLKLPARAIVVKSPVGWLSLIAFSLALLCKEMAASLPLVVFACTFFLSEKATICAKVRQSAFITAPYFALLAVYFLVRYLATGTVFGGYIGAVGEANIFSWSSVIDRFAHFWKVAYPFNEELIERKGVFESGFGIFYFLFGIHILARMRFDRFSANQLRLIGFLFSWLILQFLPLYQVFMIHNSLAGSRLFYLSTAVLAIIAAVLLAPGRQKGFSQSRKRIFNSCAAFLFCILTGLSVFVGRQNNQCWIVAARHVEELQSQINSAVATLPDEKKLLIAYLPIQVLGAHMFNRYYLIESLLSPPLLNPDLSKRVSVLEPRFYTYNHLVPSGPLRKKLEDTASFQTVYWDVDQWKLTDLAAKAGFDRAESLAVGLPELNIEKGKLRGMTDIKATSPFKTRAVKFVDVDLENSQTAVRGKKDVLVLAFDERRKPPQGIDIWCQANYDTGLKFQTVRFPVDEKFAWFLSEEMSGFRIFIGERHNLKITAARLNDGKTLIPSLSASNISLRACNDGAYRPLKYPIEFNYDVSSVPGAVACLCELSRPRAMFQLENFTYRDALLSKKPLRKWTEKGTIGSILLGKEMFADKACYQLRVFAQKADGSVCGTSSDLIDLGINDRPVGQEL